MRRVLAALTISLFGGWGALLLWFAPHLPAAWHWLILGCWCLVCTAAVAAMWLSRWRRLAVALFVVSAIALTVWWRTDHAAANRQWADDVARAVTAQMQGTWVTLHNVRNFHWHSQTHYDVRWETRQYDLDELQSVDLILNYWMGPHIAHTLISFGFTDGRYLTFSAEIRKEAGEHFSAIGGFFRGFELVLIAADERDIIRLRTNIRHEDAYLYRMQVPASAVRELFLAYLEEANRLAADPRYYNTVTSNCTTIVFDLARQISPSLPLDYRLLLSGHFAAYAKDQGGLTPGLTLAELRDAGYLNTRANQIAASDDTFSMQIRRGIPGIVTEAAAP